MPSKKLGGEKPVDRQVGLAVAAVRRAVGRLVQLLDGEDAVVEEAARALLALGAPAVVGPLGEGLLRARSLRHRTLIFLILVGLGEQERVAVYRAIFEANKHETNLGLSIRMSGALLTLSGSPPSDQAPGSTST